MSTDRDTAVTEEPTAGAETEAEAELVEAEAVAEPEVAAEVAVEAGAERLSSEATAEAEAAEAAEAEAEAAEAEAAEAEAAEAEAEAAEAEAELSEAAAELAAQRELRARIEQRKAEKAGPIAAGAKLSGRAADLLAAVRAVESGAPVDPALLKAVAPAVAPPPPVAPSPDPRPAARATRPSSAPSSAPAPDPGTVAAVRAVLAEGGAPPALAGQVSDALGERAAEALREDPWRLLAVAGVRPEQADGFARALLGAACGPGDERRAAALAGWLLEQAALRGHTALAEASVRTALAGHAVPDPAGAVRHAVAEAVVLEFRDGPEEDEADTDPDEPGAETAAAPVLLALDRYALAEESLADGLARLLKTCSETSWEEAAAGAASSSAAELIRAAAGHGLVAHTGGEAARAEPVALAGAVRALGMRAAVAVHSENGRDRLAAGPEPDAVTVAGLLSGAAGPGRDADGLFALDLLVVLDAPQLDVETAAMLVESLPDGARLVLSGDPGVLASAGAGRVFGDLLAARVCPRVASRTPDPGPVGELVSGIGVGELHQVAAPGKEVVIVPVRDAGEAVHRAVQLVAESVPRAFGVTAGETQVITVGHGGPAGTRALNAALKQRLNPGPGAFGGFDPGDRVAHVPAPGRTLQGVVVSADAEGLRLDCGGTPVLVPRERVESAVRHGWALTAHQAAGMRWPAAVVVLPGDAAGGLSRPWVYTAFGRGDRHLSVVHGVDQALARAVADVPAQDRTTRLGPLLEALLAPADLPG